MKILLNLLPEEKKTTMHRNNRFRMLITHGSGFIFLAFLYCCTLFGISFLLSLQHDSVRGVSGDTSFAAEKQEIESYEKTFRETNARISEISQLTAKHVVWEPLFRAIERATPESVFYTKMVAKNDLSFTATGTASDRESLLLLEKNIEESDCFRSKDGIPIIPLSNKLVKENIEFQLDAVIEKRCLVVSESGTSGGEK